MDRRNRPVKFIREDFFLGPTELKVGAVVMISGATMSCVSLPGSNGSQASTGPDGGERHVRRGTGGGFCAAAWSFAFAAS